MSNISDVFLRAEIPDVTALKEEKTKSPELQSLETALAVYKILLPEPSEHCSSCGQTFYLADASLSPIIGFVCPFCYANISLSTL